MPRAPSRTCSPPLALLPPPWPPPPCCPRPAGLICQGGGCVCPASKPNLCVANVCTNMMTDPKVRYPQQQHKYRHSWPAGMDWVVSTAGWARGWALLTLPPTHPPPPSPLGFPRPALQNCGFCGRVCAAGKSESGARAWSGGFRTARPWRGTGRAPQVSSNLSPHHPPPLLALQPASPASASERRQHWSIDSSLPLKNEIDAPYSSNSRNRQVPSPRFDSE